MSPFLSVLFWAATWSGTLDAIFDGGGEYSFRLEAEAIGSASLTIKGAVAGLFDCTSGEVTVHLPNGDASVVVTHSHYGVLE